MQIDKLTKKQLNELDSLNTNNLVKIIPLLTSVQDRKNIRTILGSWKPDTVYHAAAYKHVPIVEHNLAEGVKNNVFGTLTIAQASLDNGISDFVFISTDKAVRPNNVMGTTKRLCEIYVKYISNKFNKNFSIVRFGNVVGSSGSVIPLFINQIKKGGPLTVTDPEVTRYFMTIPDAASLIINVNFISKGGEVFVLDMGQPIKILDIANHMKSLAYSISNGNFTKGEIDIIFTGLRNK